MRWFIVLGLIACLRPAFAQETRDVVRIELANGSMVELDAERSWWWTNTTRSKAFYGFTEESECRFPTIPFEEVIRLERLGYLSHQDLCGEQDRSGWRLEVESAAEDGVFISQTTERLYLVGISGYRIGSVNIRESIPFQSIHTVERPSGTPVRRTTWSRIKALLGE